MLIEAMLLLVRKPLQNDPWFLNSPYSLGAPCVTSATSTTRNLSFPVWDMDDKIILAKMNAGSHELCLEMWLGPLAGDLEAPGPRGVWETKAVHGGT